MLQIMWSKVPNWLHNVSCLGSILCGTSSIFSLSFPHRLAQEFHLHKSCHTFCLLIICYSEVFALWFCIKYSFFFFFFIQNISLKYVLSYWIEHEYIMGTAGEQFPLASQPTLLESRRRDFMNCALFIIFYTILQTILPRTYILTVTIRTAKTPRTLLLTPANNWMTLTMIWLRHEH